MYTVFELAYAHIRVDGNEGKDVKLKLTDRMLSLHEEGQNLDPGDSVLAGNHRNFLRYLI